MRHRLSDLSTYTGSRPQYERGALAYAPFGSETSFNFTYTSHLTRVGRSL